MFPYREILVKQQNRITIPKNSSASPFRSSVPKNNSWVFFPIMRDRRINHYRKDPANNKSPVRRFDFGVGFMIGYEMKYRMQFNFYYQLGFRNMLGDVFENVDMISQMFSLGVGYRFLN